MVCDLMAIGKRLIMEKGQISVSSENIFPIIKRYLYSEQEIFLRELISNAVDATNKLKTLASRGEYDGDLGNLMIEVIPDKEQKTLTIRDHGIGLTADEAKKYLNQVAFSSAHEFIEKYKEDANIIGNFGLGFYSAFMVSNLVEVGSLSYKKDAQAIKWSCDGSTQYQIEDFVKTSRGTDVVLHIDDESMQYLEESKLTELLDKYCKFLPIPIKLGTKKVKNGTGDDAKEIEVDNIINNTHPLWKKNPSELTDEDYISFYKELYPYSSTPMFWIHLNIDYPFNLTGVLYFPRVESNFDIQKNKIHLYSNQVFVTDNVQEIVPEWLMMLHGVIDSPDIPLNVSRSYLQADSNVRKITGYITKKVAEKLLELFNKDRKEYEEKWNDISTFIKYGYISDDKFEEKAQDFILFENTSKAYYTLNEYEEKIKDKQTNKDKKIVFLYTNNVVDHHSYLEAAKDKGLDVLIMNSVIDNHFMQSLEHKKSEIIFKRVDSESISKLVDQEQTIESLLDEDQKKAVESLFSDVVNNPMIKVEVANLEGNEEPIDLVRPEFMRRFTEMQMLSGQHALMDMDMYQVVVNANHSLIHSQLLTLEGDAQKSMAKEL